MERNWASENLQVIRTLMERSTTYRRALAPMMLFTGCVGLLAAGLGYFCGIESPGPFVGYWMGISLLPLTGCLFLARRQALKESEPFWSPPLRRVAQALLPPLFIGVVVGIIVFFHVQSLNQAVGNVVAMCWLPLVWVILYGCAIHAAGFFMPRGMKFFGWVFILAGCGLFAWGIPDLPRGLYAHGVMGFFFGALHLAYGIYLYFTEKRKNAA